MLPWIGSERSQTTICCLEWLGRFNYVATGLDACLLSFSTSGRYSRIALNNIRPLPSGWNKFWYTFIVLSMEQQIPSDLCTHHIAWDEYLGNSSLYESHNFFSGLPHDRVSQWWFLFVWRQQTNIFVFKYWRKWSTIFKDMFRHAYAIFSLIVNNKYVIQLYNTKYE